MKLMIMTTYDKAAECFGRPFFTVSVGVAVRSFVDEVNREDSGNPLFMHPGDYTLYHLGEFHDDSGEFNVFDDPQVVLTGDKARNHAS